MKKLPILILTFNRPVLTKSVLEKIAKYGPDRLYVASDGPRKNKNLEKELVSQTRQLFEELAWPCAVKKLYRVENLGCQNAVSQAIDWFFENEKYGIVLEDDCRPDEDFFRFCEYALEEYKNDNSIWAITGINLQDGRREGDGSYFVSKYMHVWGWATWRENWQQRNMNMNGWSEWRQSKDFKEWIPDFFERRYWKTNFDRTFRGEINTWAYRWMLTIWMHHGRVITPETNLVSNIGFGIDGTHTHDISDPKANRKTYKLSEIVKPSNLEINEVADLYLFNKHLGGHNKRFPVVILTLLKRLLKLIL